MTANQTRHLHRVLAQRACVPALVGAGGAPAVVAVPPQAPAGSAPFRSPFASTRHIPRAVERSGASSGPMSRYAYMKHGRTLIADQGNCTKRCTFAPTSADPWRWHSSAQMGFDQRLQRTHRKAI